MTLETCTHDVDDFDNIQGGTRQYREGVMAFIAIRDEDDILASVSSFDAPGLAAALRRAADQIEGKAESPFKLPPVTVPMGAVCMNCGEHYDGLPGPVGFCSSNCAQAAHAAIVNPHDWRF